MTGIIDRYLARHVIVATALVALLLVALSAFLQLLGQLDALDDSYRLPQALHYVLLSTPQQFYELLPMSALLGALIGLGQLSSGHELMVMRASGLSVLRIARGAIAGGVIIALAAVAVGELVAPSSEQAARELRNLARFQRVSWLGPSGVWARDGNRFVNVRQMISQDRLRNVDVYEFGPDGELVAMMYAREAQVDESGWSLRDIRTTRFDGERIRRQKTEQAEWSTLLSPSLLRLFVIDPDTLSLRGLVDYMQYLERNGLDTARYRQAMWTKIIMPFSVLTMILLALPFVFGPMRDVGQGQRAMVGVLVGVTFYVLNMTLAQSGLVFGLNPLLSALLPTLLFAVGSVWALSRVR